VAEPYPKISHPVVAEFALQIGDCLIRAHSRVLLRHLRFTTSRFLTLPQIRTAEFRLNHPFAWLTGGHGVWEAGLGAAGERGRTIAGGSVFEQDRRGGVEKPGMPVFEGRQVRSRSGGAESGVDSDEFRVVRDTGGEGAGDFEDSQTNDWTALKIKTVKSTDRKVPMITYSANAWCSSIFLKRARPFTATMKVAASAAPSQRKSKSKSLSRLPMIRPFSVLGASASSLTFSIRLKRRKNQRMAK